MKKTAFFWIFVSLTLNGFAQNRGASADIPTPSLDAIGNYYALLIGVAQYDQPDLTLQRPVEDARTLKEVLLDYSFEEKNIKLLSSPTRNQIMSELFRLRKVITSNDNLLIFYAGHGYWDKDIKQGYWWPRDGSRTDPSNWLSNSDIREQIHGINSAHTLLISDACFSGGIFQSREVSLETASTDIKILYKMPSRRAMTSGSISAVPDQSVFFEYLIKRLRQNTEGYLSSQSLFDSFRKAVINNSRSVPQDGVISDSGDEGGDFIFVNKNRQSTLTTSKASEKESDPRESPKGNSGSGSGSSFDKATPRDLAGLWITSPGASLGVFNGELALLITEGNKIQNIFEEDIAIWSSNSDGTFTATMGSDSYILKIKTSFTPIILQVTNNKTGKVYEYHRKN